MASFHGNRFPGPMFNQHFPRNNFNTNPAGNRFSMPPFQRPSNPAFRPYQTPERFMSGNFQNRPHFSNFPEPAGPSGFWSRPPPNNQVFPMNPPMNPAHNFPRPRAPFERPFRPWNQIPPPPPIGNVRPHLQNRPRPSIPPLHMGELPLQPNKKGKIKIREFRKLKEDTTVKPFSCDTCDRAFVTENELKDHISQHIKCDHENCIFEAHPKIVALHKKMQHDTGYADKISKLKDDAEIQKWREERRRRFPSAKNILKRKAEQAEKEARGEVLETKEFGKFKRRKGNDGDSVKKDSRRRRGRGHKKDRRRQFHPRTQQFTINLDSDSDSDSDSHIKLNRFLGMSLANSAREITDKTQAVEAFSSPHADVTPISDEYQSPSEGWCEQNLPKSKFDDNINHPNLPCADSNSSNLDKNQTTFVLNDDNINGADTSSKSVLGVPFDKAAVIQDCSVDEELVNESICEIPVGKSALSKHKNVEVVEIRDSDDEGPIAIPIVKSVESSVDDQNKNKESQEILHSSDKALIKTSDSSNSEKRQSINNNRHQKNNHSHTNGLDVTQEVRKSSLLEKLLADDIRHERNVILQCIRHIVKNNFFGVENKCFK